MTKPTPTPTRTFITTPTRTFITTLKDGTIRKVTVPATWKLTFGSVVPYAGQQGNNHGVALRFYEGNKENLRAVMCDVASFRDEGISVVEKRTTIQRKATQKQTARGAKDVVIEARMTEWVNPDSDDDDSPMPEEFLTLTHSEPE